MRKIRPDDDTMILVERDSAPFHIGALLLYDVPRQQRAQFLPRIKQHFAARLPSTPLLCRQLAAPFDFDSGIWLDLDHCDLDYHIAAVESAAPMTETDIHRFVEKQTMERLDLRRPPFRVFVLDNLADPDTCALLIKVHHAVTDGIGFQHILGLLTNAEADPAAPPATPRRQTRKPLSLLWLAASAWDFWRQRQLRRDRKRERSAAQKALGELRKDPTLEYSKTPALQLPNPDAGARRYTTVTLSLDRFKAIGRAADATVNDVFLTICGGALRTYLGELDRLPERPLVSNSARSYRRPEHEAFGNRIVAMHPHIGTHIADPVARLQAIRQSMASERRRSEFVEKLLDREETPFGPRRRKRLFGKYKESTGRALPGNVTLSNVPGPAETRFLAGWRQRSNHPTPILEGGRFLNITMRRYRQALDVGIMLIPQSEALDPRIGELLENALDELEAAFIPEKDQQPH
jgi:WS/DGAT/MGAT family acyltransferase